MLLNATQIEINKFQRINFILLKIYETTKNNIEYTF